MFSVHAYDSNLASSTTVTYTALAPVTDPVLFSSGNVFFVGALQNLLGAYLLSPTGGKSKVFTPSILSVSPHQIAPLDTTSGALPQTGSTHQLMLSSPIKLLANEGIEFDSSNTSSTAQSRTVGLIYLSDGALAPVTGNIITIRATFTSTSTADSWQNASLTLDNTLAAGTYQLVGARVEGTNMRYFRFVFQGSSSIRPGGVCSTSVTANEPIHQRYGRMGVWGTFTNFTIPTIDHINNGNSDSAVAYLDLIKTG